MTSDAPLTQIAVAEVKPAPGEGNGPLTILQVVPRLEAGGVERGALEIAEAIVAAGGRALVASAGGRMEARFRLIGAELFTLPLASKSPLKIRANTDKLVDLIRGEAVDIVHARSRAPAWSAYSACQQTGAHFVTTYHGTYTEGLPLKRLYNRVMAKGEVVIAISDFIAEHVKQRHKVEDDRLVVIARGADTRLFSKDSAAPGKVAALSHQWGLAEDLRPVILLPGRLTRWKGQTLFIEALALLRRLRGGDDFIGVMVGGDQSEGAKFEAELSRLIAKHKLESCARLVGHCDDMAAAYKLAQVAVSASLEPEAFGRVAVEAQAMGVPVIAAAHGGAQETVRDDVTGWMFEPRDASALAQAMNHALNLSSEQRERIAQEAIAHVQANYSIRTMQEATLKVYERVAGRGFATS
ncbi:MAG: glycosyltransferase family 4 protein [Neomegalonema sp.]|nr:glycosyltransferase family 4 protein [Neomegalonema sp.]